MINRTVRERLLASTIIAGAIAAATPAFAQEAGGTPPPPPTAPSGLQNSESTTPAPNSQNEIVVTGSLIRNPALVASAPVQVIGQEEVQLRQSNTAEEILRDLPGAVASVGSAVNNGNGGASYVDLRGLGSNRNIVLLDGNRIAPADLLGRVDLNNIPLALVQRVDSLTGGAATTYGADAVSGVVNFITRQDFHGVDIQVGKQITQKGDGAYYRADLTIGANFDDGRGNAVVSLGYQHADPVYQGDRGFSYTAIDSFSGNPSGSGTSTPSSFTLPTAYRQINPTTGALGTVTPFNYNPYNIFQTPFERFNIYGAGHYDISDAIEIYARGLYSKNTVTTIIAPRGSFGLNVTIPLSNPYLPAAARAQFCANNDFDPNTPGIQTITPAQCAAGALANSPTDPNYKTFTTTFRRRTTENGSDIDIYTTQVFDYRAGAKVKITSGINLDLAGSYGESTNHHVIQGYLRASRIREALLATGQGCVNASDAGCVPLNAFGANGSITPEMLAFLGASSTVDTTTSLGQGRALLSGDTGIHSPFAHSSINFAVGAEYRKYTAQQSADILSQTPGELSGTSGSTPNINGSFDVVEGYGELIAPLIEDAPFAKSLTAEGGIRRSHYKVNAAGQPTFNTTTFKGGLTWEPTDFLKLRGNYQRAVRAPNINELFSPVSTTLTNLATDPCAGAAPVGNANLRAVCLAQGAQAYQIGAITNPSAGQANVTTGGNPNVKPERANSYTVGAVLQPRGGVLRNFTATVDYYHIKIKGAITTPTSTDLVNACFSGLNASSATNPACTAIRRSPTTGGLDGDPATTPGLFGALSNLGKLYTDGIDVGVNYRRDLGFAKLNLSFQGNWTDHAKFQATPTAVNRECVGYYSTACNYTGSIQPEFYWNQRTTLTFGNIDLSLLWRHLNPVRQEPLDVTAGNGPAFVGTLNGKQVNFGKIPAYNYFDLTTRFGVGENVDLTFVVQNLLNKKPPIVGYDIGNAAFDSGNTYPSTYDALGRRFGVQARLKF